MDGVYKGKNTIMRKGPETVKKKNIAVTALAIALAVVLVLGGGTFAYLLGNTEEEVNEFSTNQNGVEITETENDYEIIPGTSQDKDPTITATYTLDSYVFVEVTDATDGLVTWYIESGWTLLETTENEDGSVTYIYYQLLTTADGVYEAELHVLADDKVYYSTSLTNEDLAGVDGVSLTFQGYIIQAEPFADAANAWLLLSGEGVAVNNETGIVYTDLADVFTDYSDGAVVQLLQDNTSATLNIDLSNGDLTIDMNGYTLYKINASSEEGATLTLINSDGENGGMKSQANVSGNANLVIDGISFSGAVSNNGTGTVEINSGTFKAVTNTSSGTLIINGGTFGGAVSNRSTGTTIINDGIFNTTTQNSSSGIMNINGGTFAKYVQNGGTGTINISGGTFNGTARSIYQTGTGTINISGGSFAGYVQTNGNGATINISGGTFNGELGKSSGTVVITGGSFRYQPTTDYIASGYVVEGPTDGYYSVVASAD
ncbi:MAG: carbohydrate-binding domain-containing protein [Oscillospiraceae bacterium]|nr:carbohydrate-binding domain-containing protein [Oscillospiraceae bacterium]